MKTLIILMLFAFTVSVGQAQEITELDEVRVGYTPLDATVVRNGDTFSFIVSNVSANEFLKNPIGFMRAYFDIKNFIASVEHENYHSYDVQFKSNKGSMVASFDTDGDLIKTVQNFKNIYLPQSLREQIYVDNSEWNMVKNKYVAYTKGDIITKEIYKITLENGNKRKSVRIDGKNQGLSVASN